MTVASSLIFINVLMVWGKGICALVWPVWKLNGCNRKSGQWESAD